MCYNSSRANIICFWILLLLPFPSTSTSRSEKTIKIWYDYICMEHILTRTPVISNIEYFSDIAECNSAHSKFIFSSHPHNINIFLNQECALCKEGEEHYCMASQASWLRDESMIWLHSSPTYAPTQHTNKIDTNRQLVSYRALTYTMMTQNRGCKLNEFDICSFTHCFSLSHIEVLLPWQQSWREVI